MYIIGQEEVDAVQRVIESKQLFRYRGGEGGETDQFEKEWSKKIGVEHTVAVTSGTAALISGDHVSQSDVVRVSDVSQTALKDEYQRQYDHVTGAVETSASVGD